MIKCTWWRSGCLMQTASCDITCVRAIRPTSCYIVYVSKSSAVPEGQDSF